MATPILLDCDPGHDDAVAMLLAAANDAIDLRAITTVAGNCPLELATLNARRVAALAGSPASRSRRARPARWTAPSSTPRRTSTA